MPKRFNVTGTCFADEHYMADISGKLAEALAMIADGAYFTINRPRQYGKTTMLASIADALRNADDYVVFEVSFEGLGAAEFASTADFCEAFLGLLLLQAEFDHALTEAGEVLRDGMERADKMSSLSMLISRLAHKVDKKMVLLIDDVDEAARRLIYSTRSNTNFDSLIKNLENHPELYDLVYRLIIDNETLQLNTQDPLINLGMLHGILRNGEGLRIHNRIYAEVISNYMISKLTTSSSLVRTQTAGPYLVPGNALDVELLLSNFQAYMKEEHSSKDWAFLERNGRLVFLAFVKPILNGKGHTFKEPQISQEQRLDVAITFLERKYIVELKIWRGPKQHEEGLTQLANYLDAQGLAEGYLVIFDPRAKERSWAKEWIEVGGKRIFAIWV